MVSYNHVDLLCNFEILSKVMVQFLLGVSWNLGGATRNLYILSLQFIKAHRPEFKRKS
jgi:hypothetical protein